ncbi:restriction endonuclease subunit S [Leptospira idonii]|uniref:Restriction endonuclease subunit S n=1 Tax=Leptospira idonii TaxID=1193500 RepID=A0A4R9M079_9LEPT|nr:restriction endonuclease subunit S [Leptospira idonii]TGN18035.1 restriction endonuclease subunit S [Leptospira idonii]
MNSKIYKLSDLISENGLYVDGDWIESKDQDPNGDVRLIQLADIGDGHFLNKSSRYMNIEDAKRLNCTFLEKGDILIARMPDPLGRACIFPGISQLAVTVVDICIVRPASEKVDVTYLKFLINNQQFRREIVSYTTGTTRKRISRTNLDKITFPLPPLEEQIHIANVLSKAEALIAKRKESLALLDAYLKSVFLEMFGEIEAKKQKWPVVQINDLAANHKGAMRTGPFGSNLLHSEFSEDGDVAVLGIDNAVKNKFSWGAKRFISKEKYEELKAYRIFPGDVIITIMGTVGRSAVIPDDIPLAINTKHLAALTFNKEKANPKFICFSFQSNPSIIKQMQSKNRGAIMDGLNLTLIKEIRLPLPPLDLQNQFAAVVEKVEALKETYQKSLVELENLYGSLSQRAFRGELGGETQHAAAKNPKAEKEPAIKNKTSITEASDSLPSSNIIEFKPTNVDYYKRTVLAAEIVWQLQNEPTLGHLKLQKLMYLCIKSADMQLPVNFLKQAMGPFDPSLMRSIDKQLKDKKWFQYETNQSLKYRKLEKAGEHQKDFIKYYGNQKDQIHYLLKKFKTTSSDTIEIVATLYACYENILMQKEVFSETLLFQRFYEWSEHKKEFDELEVKKVFNRMKEAGVVPKG